MAPRSRLVQRCRPESRLSVLCSSAISSDACYRIIDGSPWPRRSSIFTRTFSWESQIRIEVPIKRRSKFMFPQPSKICRTFYLQPGLENLCESRNRNQFIGRKAQIALYIVSHHLPPTPGSETLKFFLPCKSNRKESQQPLLYASEHRFHRGISRRACWSKNVGYV